MAHDVFISYSSLDRATADAVCRAVEARGIRCWMAPRDLSSGGDWPEAIVKAIRAARAVVLIFSGHVNDSDQVKSEVNVAFGARPKKPVILFRIEDVEMDDGLFYFFSSRHWHDALTSPLDPHVERLVAELVPLVGSRTAVEPPAGERDRHPASKPGSGLTSGAVAQFDLRGGPVAGQPPRAAKPTPPPSTAAVTPDLGAEADEELTREIERGDHPDVQRRRRFQAAAERGDANAQMALAAMLAQGEGGTRDDAAAVRWFRSAAEQGNPSAQYRLAVMYALGRGVVRNDAEAARWYRIAAEGGDVDAQFALGRLHAEGREVVPNPNGALPPYQLAADQGREGARREARLYAENPMPHANAVSLVPLPRSGNTRAARDARAALDAVRPLIGRLDHRGHPEDAAADLIKGWAGVEVALRALMGSSSRGGQLVSEGCVAGLLDYPHALGLLGFLAARDRAPRPGYRATAEDVEAAKAGFQAIEAAAAVR